MSYHSVGTEQYKFILDDLRSVNRSRTPWVIVGGHRPFYISSNNRLAPDSDQVVAQQLRAALEDIFLQYKVGVGWLYVIAAAHAQAGMCDQFYYTCFSSLH